MESGGNRAGIAGVVVGKGKMAALGAIAPDAAKQLEQDIAEGKLEALAQNAIAECEVGDCREI